MIIEIPNSYRSLLDKDDHLLSFMIDFLRAGSEVLRDNRVVFFRGYTDHGSDHIERVIRDSLRLIPPAAFDCLTPTDACVIIGSSVLHDFALHLSEAAFAEVVSGEFKVPRTALLPDGANIPVDKGWNELWTTYIEEALRWNDIQESRIFGPEFKRPSRTNYKKLLQVDASTRYDDEFGKPLVGEFIRRHHARLAHEIALSGYPGLSPQEFGVLAERDFELADLVGFVARSHHLSMRQATDHVRLKCHGDLAPLGCHVAYCMALLRVVDYLQIDDVRAPTLLLRLRDPKSPLSIEEWQKHAAVRTPSYTHEDPECIYYPVRQDHSYRTHLLLHELLKGLQSELDETNASLREVYRDHSDLHVLRLRYSRIRSNLLEDDFAERLPYIADNVTLSVDPRIISLIVEPLYEKRPECGVRELMQNGIDAVLERDAFEKSHKAIKKNGYPEFPEDVRIVAEKTDGKWTLTITDKGIGMSLDVIKNSFLRAGASFRNSDSWKDEFLDAKGQGSVRRSGKFGVGAFAAFLLGESVTVTTRRVTEEHGYEFTFHLNSTEIQVNKSKSSKLGTEIVIELSNYAVEQLELEADSSNPRLGWDWFTLAKPHVKRFILVDDKSTELQQDSIDPTDFEYASGQWRRLPSSEFDDVFWSVDRAQGQTTCNGIKIGKPSHVNPQPNDGKLGKGRIGGTSFQWEPPYIQITPPSKLSVIDFEGSFPVTLQRHACEGHQSAELSEVLKKDIAIDFVAFCVACAPKEPFPSNIGNPEYFERHPLITAPYWFFAQDYSDLRKNRSERLVWCSTKTEVMPFAPFIVAPHEFSSIVYQGSATQSLIRSHQPTLTTFQFPDSLNCCVKDHSDSLPPHWWPGQEREVKCHFPFAARLLERICLGEFTEFGAVDSAWYLLVGNIPHWKEMLNGANLELSNIDVVDEDEGLILYKYGNAEIDDSVTQAIAQLKGFPTQGLRHRMGSVHMKINLKQRVKTGAPDGLLEETWEKFVGSRGIPFDSAARKNLIDEVVAKDERLKAYHDAWVGFEPEYRKQVRSRR